MSKDDIKKKNAELLLCYLQLFPLMKGAGPTLRLSPLRKRFLFFLKSPHTSWHSVSETQWDTGGSSFRLTMAALWNLEQGSYLNVMSLYGERSRYLYSKMCCAGEWRDLWTEVELVSWSAVFSAW